MRNTVPGPHRPADQPLRLPATLADRVLDTIPLQRTACPDGRPWCTGEPRDHSDPREHIHQSPELSMTGSYGTGLAAFCIAQHDDDRPELAFAGRGDWPDLDLDQVDELIADMAEHLRRLRAARAALAALLGQGR
ncbi:hypothetical protein LIX60_17530 [Streptomyces sp. S07_1.15]|uniref:DUF6907 domain-containing protein n=1 Tax=Streptomyces sp. S07_1.15 TaxID=2873925 RepID=UPI001D15BCF1|nr:hypothetical protein [Streptomyces sp. S07_1.15]MCC3653231.1 hypothetical protein [Streptomyces sp. S07_1.15]